MQLNVIGLMSGTSVDGLDICYVHFDHSGSDWKYRILLADSVDYPEDLKYKLLNAQSMTALEFARLNSDYGLYLGEKVRDFIEKNKIKPDLIASHGQTIFHQPAVKFTSQIGSGAGIAAVTGVDTVCDFRTTDVALGGQGAPLVPIGDKALFGGYDYCLNIGGFSNISFGDVDRGERRAFDISPVNFVLNFYMRRNGADFDRDGLTARSGKVCEGLLNALNNLPFYKATGPKSLGREWVEKEVFPLIDSYTLSLEDKLRTYVEHAAIQISEKVSARADGKPSTVLVTGGGALNKFLIERMQAVAPQAKFIVPDALTVNFKEALIFALLGALYLADEPNCLSTVTGALRNNIGGCLYKGNR